MSEALLRALQQRAALNALVRRFFAERDVLEVETPILSVAGNTEPNIDSFHTDFTGHVDAGGRRRWLRTSPEYPLKRLLAAGVGDCYELGRVFRNGEAGGRHNPEFTMLEFYWAYAHLNDLIDLTEEMIGGLCQQVVGDLQVKNQDRVIDFAKPFQRFTMIESILHFNPEV